MEGRLKKMRKANFEVSDSRDIGFMAVGTSAKLLGFIWENIAGPRGLWSRKFFLLIHKTTNSIIYSGNGKVETQLL